MSKLPITNDLPRTIIRGFKDESGAPLVFEEDALPIHLPLIFGFAEWGPHDELVLCGGSGFNTMFGINTLDQSKPFATHTGEIINAMAPAGNLFFYRRFLGEGAKRASGRLSVEVVNEKITQYERNIDGTFLLDADGQLQETGTPVDGKKLRWVLTEATAFGQANPAEGTLVSSEGAVSKRYPIMDIPGRFFGARGGNLGFRLQAPTSRSNVASNTEDAYDMGSFLFRFFSVKRADEFSTSTIQSTRQGEQYVDFSFKKGAMSPTTMRKYFIDDVLNASYETTDPELFDGYGSFDKIHVYHANMATVLEELKVAEEAFQDIEDKYLLNPLTGVNLEGISYYAIQVEDVSNNGLLFTENSSHFLLGGSDGTMGPDKLDELTEAELNAFEDGEIPYMDMAAFPFSCFYDSGFGMKVKRALPALYARPDMYFVAATQIAGKKLNTSSEDSSVAASLRALYRSVPESTHFGTGACRGVVLAHAGVLIGSSFEGVLPFTIAFARKCAEYMGAATGFMNPNARFSSAPGNVVADYRDHNVKFRKESARSEDWKNGLVFAQTFGMRSIFWPAIQTIYDDKTSILSSFFNMAICCNLTRVGERAWRWFVGDDQRTREEFLRDVRLYVTEETTGRFDDRGQVEPLAYYTEMDDTLGYAWHLDITWSGRNQPRVETLTIIAKRLTADTAAEA